MAMHSTFQSDVYDTLCSFMKLQPDQITDQVKTDIEAFFAHCAEGMETDSQKLLATLLLKALNMRIHSEFIGENIYLGKYEISQIQLFNILIEKFPFVKYSQQITNKAIVEAMQGSAEVTLVDIGIGQGTQVLNIIEQAKNLPQLKKLHIVGIEPYGDALAIAETNILVRNGSVPFEITFTGICDGVENVDFATIDGLAGTIIVNASLALHHIQSERLRRETIARVKALNPGAFILIEPNVNHYEPDFYTRFLNCYNHFYSIFQVIDRIENISNADKNALKLFFGREIEDIIGKEEKDRYEKHEPALHWIERLQESHFAVRNELLQTPVRETCGVRIDHHPEGFLGFTFEDETVLAVIYAEVI